MKMKITFCHIVSKLKCLVFKKIIINFLIVINHKKYSEYIKK